MNAYERNWSKRKTKKWKISKHRYSMQQQLLYFDLFSYKMTSNGINIYIDGFYTSRSFQWYQEHKFRVHTRKLWPQQFMVTTTTFFSSDYVFSSCSVVATTEYSWSRPHDDLGPNINFSPFSTHSQESYKRKHNLGYQKDSFGEVSYRRKGE